MSKVWYGSLNNRLEENRMYCNKIEVGTGATVYYYSDSYAYEVIEVIDQKHVKIRSYDHKPAGECFSNEWKLISNPNGEVKELVYRYNHWYDVITYKKEEYENKYDLLDPNMVKSMQKKGYYDLYTKINVSFGVAQYYYDYEF